MITREKTINYLQTIVKRGGTQHIRTSDLERIGLPFELLLTGRKYTTEQAEEQLVKLTPLRRTT